jgi:hypothetical protein
MDLCHEYQELLVSAGETAERAVATSLQCRSAYIDSTGQSPSAMPSLTVERGSSLGLRFTVKHRPTKVEVRLYPSAGVSGSFLKWPEELPTGREPIEQLQPDPGSEVRVPLQVPPGTYTLVVRARWEGEIDVFYAISFLLRESQAVVTQ